jgi:Flp pilus assembly protein TadD
VRNTCISASEALFFFASSCLATNVVTVRGELTCQGCNYYTNYTVELRNMNGTSPSIAVPVRMSGEFEAQAHDGTYTLTVSNGGRVLKTDIVTITDPSAHLIVRLAGNTDVAKPGTGVVSVARLEHKVPKKAKKEYEKAHKRLEAGDVDGSLEHLKRATEIDPEYLEAWNNLGCRYLMKKDIGLAFAAFQRALAIDAQAALVQTNMGIVLVMLGRPAEAEQATRKAVAINPANGKARNVLGFSLYLQKKYTDETIKLLTAAAVSAPKARVALAHALAERGQQDAARTILAKHLNSGQPEARAEAQQLTGSLH